MVYLKKLGKIILYTLFSIVILGLLLNTLYYFNIISNNIYNILKMIIVIASLFINSIILGISSNKYGFVEGLKLGGIFIIVMMIIKVAINSSFDIKSLIYSVILLLTTTTGSVIGINKKK